MSTWGNDSPAPGGEPEFTRLIDSLRVLQDTVSGIRPPDDVAKQARLDVEQLNRLLEPYAVPEAEQLAGRVFSVPGRAHALLPVVRVDEDDEFHLSGHVTFGRYFLGGGGAAHGGAIPLLFDEILGRLANTGGRPMSRTAYLNVDFRSITPIDVELRLEARFDREEGRKRFLIGTLYDGETVTAQAEGLFIALRPGQP